MRIDHLCHGLLSGCLARPPVTRDHMSASYCGPDSSARQDVPGERGSERDRKSPEGAAQGRDRVDRATRAASKGMRQC
jgi:hypothetical protein